MILNGLRRTFRNPFNHPKPSSITFSSQKQSLAAPKYKKAIVAVGTSVILGGAYGYYLVKKSSIIGHAEIYSAKGILRELPPTKITKSINNVETVSPVRLILYQYQTCPFCCKVRAFLDYYGLNYDVVEVDPVLRTELKWSNWRKVPIVLGVTPHAVQQMNDSSMIVSALKTHLNNPNQDFVDIASGYPIIEYVNEDGKKMSEVMNRYFLMNHGDFPKHVMEAYEEERKWRRWADEVLVHVLSPNVYRSPMESLETFKWFSEVGEWEKVFPTWERQLVVYVGAAAMYFISKRLKKRHNLYADVRNSLYKECNHWISNIKKKGTTFMGGKTPDLGDLAVYGVLNAIEGCQAFKDLLMHTDIEPWYHSMKLAVSNHEGVSRLKDLKAM